MWVLLLLPFAGLLWVPFYNHVQPELFGFPFFYWYQLLLSLIHISEPTRPRLISYAVFCLKKKKK